MQKHKYPIRPHGRNGDKYLLPDCYRVPQPNRNCRTHEKRTRDFASRVPLKLNAGALGLIRLEKRAANKAVMIQKKMDLLANCFTGDANPASQGAPNQIANNCQVQVRLPWRFALASDIHQR